MPFVEPECRQPDHISCSVGDLCFKEYAELVKTWKENPRWTTFHDQFRNITECSDEAAAKVLALWVFFIKYVMSYEDIKERENGTI